MARKNDVEQIRMFVASLITDEQNAHSKLIAALRDQIGGTTQFDDTLKVLTRVYEVKIEILEKIYKKVQSI
ncbi:hypothetical protein LCGC14_1986860 [marine sediment metagenome]|uniref:Uncharacterized protein n=1 Tax=marine sediment metagenome TaxID=412755 RepID=A0A0F9F7F8_9ZZZZ